MAGLMYDAVMSMGAPRSPDASLLPSGLSFDLFVTLTDYHGYHELIQIHDPPLIHEQEHHHVLHFSYRRRPNGEVDSDFVLDNAPGLAFAARATSSFPGAFPPALITEMDELVVRRKGSWHKRAEFIARNFDGHVRAGLDPTTASFIDGAILNNRPFQQAISAIHGRPAYRQVDRRLVYIDPHPGTPTTPLERAVPGFFSTLRGALSDIPSSQPVTDELGWVIEFNEQVRRLRAIIASARPHISELVAEVVTHTFDRPISGKELRFWREQVNSHVARDAGFAYEAYVRFKLASVRRFVTQTIVRLRGMPAQSPLARVVSEIIDTWAVRRHIAYDRSGRDALDFEVASVEKLPDWVNFLLAFDVKYRERRLHFLIEGQNRLYQMIEKDGLKDFNPLVIDRLKRDFYGRLDALRVRETPGFFSADAHKMVADIFPTVPTAGEIRNLEQFANDFVELHRDKLDQLIARLSDEINLNASTRDIDELLAALKFDEWHPDARREVLVNYLGFPFWDVLTFPVTSTRQMGEFNEILVDRISPQDARSLKGFDGPECLKGIGLGHFAGFLSRGYRENDYLLGRLHALDRLIDIVCDSAGLDAEDNIDVVALKKKGFTRILQAEAKHLPKSKDLIATLYRCIDDIAAP
jgi:patatin-related protein